MRAMWEACRPLNMLMALLATLVGAVLGGGAPALAGPWPWLAALSTVTALAAGNVWNDVADAREDAINRPRRPIPSGRLTARNARLGANALAGVALALAIPLGPWAIAWVALCLAMLAWYAWRGKQLGLAGNVAVAALGMAAVGLGTLAAHLAAPLGAHPARALVPAVMAGILHLARELAKDAEDREGDAAAGRRSLVIRHGLHATRRLLCQLAVLAVVPPLLALLLANEAAPLRGAHLAALFVAPLLLRRVLATDLSQAEASRRLSGHIKTLLAGGLLLYVLAALWAA